MTWQMWLSLYMFVGGCSPLLYPTKYLPKEPDFVQVVLFGILWPYVWAVLFVLYMLEKKRMTKLVVPKEVVDFAEHSLSVFLNAVTFEVNDLQTQIKTEAVLAHECENRLAAYAYQVVCDASNNPPSVINNHDLVVDVVLQCESFSGIITFSNAGAVIRGWNP